MKRFPFERPTSHYDDQVLPIDEQLCGLIRQRKQVSGNNPGFPPLEQISDWAEKFGLSDDMLKSVFSSLWNEEQFKPVVEPEGFRMFLPVLKTVEKEGRIYTVTYIRQYNNSSVINLNVEWDALPELPYDRPRHSICKLSLGQRYNCRMGGGGGSSDHFTYKFIVDPPLPDEISGLNLIFKEFTPGDKPEEHEIIIQI